LQRKEKRQGLRRKPLQKLQQQLNYDNDDDEEDEDEDDDDDDDDAAADAAAAAAAAAHTLTYTNSLVRVSSMATAKKNEWMNTHYACSSALRAICCICPDEFGAAAAVACSHVYRLFHD
jgi:hypothetical protein